MSDSEYEFDDAEAGLTSVLLGFTGKEVVHADLSVLDNHVGGIPCWFGNEPPSSELLQCKVCSKSLDLLAQLSCPLPEKDYDRSIYIFSCADPNCRRKEGSVRAIRGIESNDKVRQRLAEEIEESKPENSLVPKLSGLGDSLFATGNSNVSNPFADSSAIAAPASAASAASQNSKAKKKTKTKTKKQVMSIHGKYICKFVEVEEEYLQLPDVKQFEGVKVEPMETEEADAEGSSTAATSANVKELEARGDPVFAHFIEVVESNPEQVLRYERGLKPLLYSADDGVPAKLSSLKGKVLEVQLMPHLIAELETEDMIKDGMEWGTIFVATDSEDKLPPLNENGIGYIEEWVAVQWE